MPAPNIYVSHSDCLKLIKTLEWVKTACQTEESQLESIDKILKTLNDHVYYNLTPPMGRKKLSK